MYNFWHELLKDKKGGEIFTLFSLWHFFYIALTAIVIVLSVFYLRKKDNISKTKLTSFLINLAFGMYVADFFLMPLAYNEIDIEKLPFHVCTTMCVMCFLSYRINRLEKYRMSFVKLGFISNLVYLIYPAGVMWHAVGPLSYRVIQTLLFHSVMTVYGFLMLIFDDNKTDIRKDLLVIAGMVIWALIGNYTYNGTSEEYSHFFNWFFVCQDPFNILPQTIVPYIMPFINIAAFFTVEMLFNFVFLKLKGIIVRNETSC